MVELSNGKVRRSAEEWRAIFSKYESSGLSRDAFCRREKLSPTSFGNWRRRLEREQRSSGEVEFVELSSGESAAKQCELEVSFPGGVVLRIRG